MPELTNPEPPDVLAPADPGFLAGDSKDDDGVWIDEAFEAGPTGPEDERVYLEYQEEELPKPTRILSREVVVGTVDGILYDAVLAFPADINRTSLIIETDGPITITSDKTDANGAAIFSGPQFSTDTHTGAVWINSSALARVNVSIWAVTS